MARATKQRRSPKPVATSTTAEGTSATSTGLRLAVTRSGLGLELGKPLGLGWFEVDELSVALVGLTFPVDLSGGVARFRHRRGLLERLALRASRERAQSALAPRLRNALGVPAPALTLAPTDGGISFGLSSGKVALAFDLYWAPSGQDARWVVGNARALGLRMPALAAATHVVDAIVGQRATRRGVVTRLPQAPLSVARELLPPLGARAPDTRQVVWGLLEPDAQGWRVACDASFSPALLAKHVVTELELAGLAESSDEELAAGNLDEARHGYAALLERAPRDPEIARRIADIDRCVGGRVEAALTTITEFMPIVEAGPLGAELLAETGQSAEAARVFERVADRETYAPLSALALLRASELSEAARDRSRLLDAAIARAPSLADPRWHRLDLRLRLGDSAGALADAEYLEASARGPHARHQVWFRAAEAFLANGQGTRAVTLYERSLRYVPDDPLAIAGLAASLLAVGRAGRALDLLARAVELADERQMPAYGITLRLAQALAETAGDLPHAVARVRSIPAGHPEAIEARGLEGRWRASLGDTAGASVAYAAMRDAIDLSETVAPRALPWLLEAARFEEGRNDLPAARRHLALAIRVAPKDRQASQLFRAIVSKQEREAMPEGAVAPRPQVSELAPRPQVSELAPRPQVGELAPRPQVGELAPRPGLASFADAPVPPPAPALPEAERDHQEQDEARAQLLEDKLRANPSDDATVLELSEILHRLGRDMDRFALVSARLEDAEGPVRETLLVHRRLVLERLIETAKAKGLADEARLYADALERG